MDASTELTGPAPDDIERAVEIFADHLADAFDDCAKAKLNNAALITAVFAGLVDITHRAVGRHTIAVLRQMIEDLDIEGSPLYEDSFAADDTATKAAKSSKKKKTGKSTTAARKTAPRKAAKKLH